MNHTSFIIKCKTKNRLLLRPLTTKLEEHMTLQDLKDFKILFLMPKINLLSHLKLISWCMYRRLSRFLLLMSRAQPKWLVSKGKSIFKIVICLKIVSFISRDIIYQPGGGAVFGTMSPAKKKILQTNTQEANSAE